MTSKKKSYMSFTSHFVDSDFKLHDRILATNFIPADIAKTGANLKVEIFKILRQFNIFDALFTFPKRLIFVTDRGSNLVCGLNEHDRLNCFAHLLNNLAKKAYQVINDNGGILETCRNVVSYIKRSGLNEFENGALKMAVDTRWNSNYDMLDSLSRNWNEVLDILNKCNATEKLNDLQKSSIDAIVAFLKPIKEATVDSEASKRPTLYLVQLYVQIIQNHLLPKPTDLEIVIQMKEESQSYFTANIASCITKYHRYAVYLHPMFKSLRSFSNFDKERIIEEVNMT